MTFITTIDDAFRERVRAWLERDVIPDALALTSYCPQVPADLGIAIRESGLRRYVPLAPGRDSLYGPVAAGPLTAYAVLIDGSEVTVPVPEIECAS